MLIRSYIHGCSLFSLLCTISVIKDNVEDIDGKEPEMSTFTCEFINNKIYP